MQDGDIDRHSEMHKMTDTPVTQQEAIETCLTIAANFKHMIPPITHPMGKAWAQPDRHKVLVDEFHAILTAKDLNQLAEYSTSVPTGAYEGKMWRMNRMVFSPGNEPEWWLCWYDTSELPDMLQVKSRRCLIVYE